MTIPEAASLVLEAAVSGQGHGRIYVLDMGTPVKIDDLARNMIRLSGLKPDEDIKIVYVDVMTAAFKEYTGLSMNKEQKKSVTQKLKKALEKSISHRERDRSKDKSRGFER